MKITDKIRITNEDCMELMKRTPDGYYDLALVDPPYGINQTSMNMGGRKTIRPDKDKSWDLSIPSDAYFTELFRVSKNQIIWGGNYFPIVWSNGCKHFIFWDKLVPEGLSFSSGELAWTSFEQANRKYTFRNITGEKIHPTQKPVALYKWLLHNYAKEGDKILDTHLGSGSIAIACHDYKFNLTACELDKEYYDKAVRRVKDHVSQLSLF